MQGAVRVAQLCHDMDLTWGVHSNNHFDISLAMVATAPPPRRASTTPATRITCGRMASTWARWPRSSRTGALRSRAIPWVSVSRFDREKLDAAHRLYVENGCGTRDDARGMQYFIPGWTYDPHRPSWCANAYRRSWRLAGCGVLVFG